MALAGARLTGAIPVPDNATVCGLPAASSTKLSVPFTAPKPVGAKVTLTMQLAPAARVSPQVFTEIAKLAVALILPIVTGTVLVSVRVTVFGTLVS